MNIATALPEQLATYFAERIQADSDKVKGWSRRGMNALVGSGSKDKIVNSLASQAYWTDKQFQLAKKLAVRKVNQLVKIARRKAGVVEKKTVKRQGKHDYSGPLMPWDVDDAAWMAKQANKAA